MSDQITDTGVGMIAPAPPDYRFRITAIQASLDGPRIEMVGRFLLPGMGVALIAVLTADPVVALLYIFFLLTQAVMFGFLATRKSRCNRAEYILALFLAGLTSTVFVGIAIYMWSTQVLIAQFAAYCMVQGFAELLGGAIAVHSAPGVGTTVRLYLPGLKQTHKKAVSVA